MNLDVFLLIGWLGYLIFVQHFWLSLLFLAVGALTKSLLGFYPVVILILYYSFLHISKKIKFVEFKKIFLKLSSHIAILTIWYLVMLIFFGKDFWQQHIIETHFRRVTASIESHFGQRTYYLDLISEQLGWLVGLSAVGFSAIVWRFLHRKLTTEKLMYTLFLFPWFIFLNLTKTKIFWYLYPAIPQFAFLSVYPLHVILNVVKNPVPTKSGRKGKYASLDPSFILRMTAGLLIIAFIFHQNFIKINFFTTLYSKPEDHYRLALYAKDRCDSLTVLVGKETREATNTLEKMGLTITSTKQWGDHPSIVYYFTKKVDFYYDKNLLSQELASFSKNHCLAIKKVDVTLNLENKGYRQVKNFNSYYLFREK